MDTKLLHSAYIFCDNFSTSSLFKMVVVHCAYTEQINPSGVSPALSRDQIWKGLQRKIRRAQDFVPVIKSCDVIEDRENEVVREAHFSEALGMPAHTVREVCKSYYPTKESSPANILLPQALTYAYRSISGNQMEQ